MSIADSYRQVMDRVQRATPQRAESPRVIAVSKMQEFYKIAELVDLGHRDFGENYVQNLLQRVEECQSQGLPPLKWHFIGHLQRNKVKALIPHLSVLHTLDSVPLAREIQKRSVAQGLPPLECYLQINIDDEDSKSGLSEGEVEQVLNQVLELDRIRLVGLMCIPSQSNSRSAFDRLAALRDRFKERGVTKLSMGMSADFEEALAAGATDIRVGSIIFGDRPTK